MNQSNLILHCGAHLVEREQVAQVATPAGTDSHTPISHIEFLEQIEANLGGGELEIVNEAHSLTHDGARYFGLLQVAKRESVAQIVEQQEKMRYGSKDWTQIVAQQDYGYVVGARNTHDRSYAASIVAGAQVFVCDNLSFSGEVKVSRLHTRFIMRDLPALVAKAIGLLSQSWTSQEKRFEAYKQKEITGSNDAVDLLISALDAKAITGQQVLPILREWRAPSHQEFVDAGETCWRLFNAVTEVAKDKNTGLWTLPRRTTALHAILDQYCGLVNVTAKDVAAEFEDAEVVQFGQN